MADNEQVEMKPTLGLTGLTMNAMALIAPGAFLWLTFVIQGTTGATAPSMWLGIVLAFCFVSPRLSVMRKWRSFIRVPAVRITSRNNRS